MRRSFYLLAALFSTTAVVSAGPIASTSQGTFAGAQNVNGSFTTNLIPTVINSTTLPHVEITQSGRPSSGFDFYSFSHGGGQVVIDIDGPLTNFDTEIGLWNAAGTLIGNNDDDFSGDPGNNSVFNSLLNFANLPAGNYIVGVGQFNVNFQSGSPYITGSSIFQGGAYNLNISATAIPEPASMALFGGLVALGGVVARRRITKVAV